MSHNLGTSHHPMFGTGIPILNLDARPNLQSAVSEEYSKWCQEHQDSTQSQRKEQYKLIYDRLRPSYPSYREMSKDELDRAVHQFHNK